MFVFIAPASIAIYTHVSPSDLIHQLSNPVVTDAIIVTVKTTIVAQVIVLAFGTPTAYFLATRQFVGRNFAITLVELPIVLPPAVAGVGLLVAFGRVGLLGSTFDFGTSASFNQAAVIWRWCSPPARSSGRPSPRSRPSTEPGRGLQALGAGPMRAFFRVTMPLAGPGLAAGQAIALARGLGEFGATIMFAGSLQGKTQTLPLAIYYAFELPNGLDISLAISALLVIFSVAILMTVTDPDAAPHLRRVLDGDSMRARRQNENRARRPWRPNLLLPAHEGSRDPGARTLR
jgi:molybdate transport system permease protein